MKTRKILLTVFTVCLMVICLCFVVNAAGENAQTALPLELEKTIDITLTEDHGKCYFKITPKKDYTYEFIAEGTALEDIYLTIYDSAGKYLESNGWNQFTNECFVAYELKANEVYYLCVVSMDLIDIDLSVSVKEHNHNLKKKYFYKATIEDDGEFSLSCNRCDYYEDCYIPYIKTVKLSDTAFIYDGAVKTPSLIIKNSDGDSLIEGTDFTTSGSLSAQSIGYYSIKISFIGDYEGTTTLSYKINPPIVTNLSVDSQTSNSITLSWDSIENVKGYIIYSYKASTKKYTKVATTSTNKIVIESLKSGTTYDYAVRAYKKVGETNCYGEYSLVVSTTTKPDSPKLKATQTTSSITLTWNNISGASGYVIYTYDTTTKKYTKILTSTTNKTTIKNLNSATGYNYAIRAYKKFNGTNYYSAYSSILKTATKPTKPKNLKASQTTTSITLTWDKVSGATSYTIYDYYADEKIATVKNNSVTIKNLYDTTNYEYYIVANAKINDKTYTSSKTIIETGTKPQPIDYFSVTAGSKKATLNWYAGYCNGYVIYMATSKNGEYKKIKTISNSDWEYSYTVKNLTKGNTYYFRIKTYIKTGSGNIYSSWSPAKSVKIK